MIIAKIRVNGTIARTVYRKAIPAGIIGAQVEFDYADDIWHGLRKTVIFKGAVTKDVVTDTNIVTIPHEVVEKPSFRLNIGVYGVDADGNIAIPTLWEDIGAILNAADPSGDTNTDPSLPIWAQIQAMVGNLDELETTARDNLVAAVNEVAQSGGSASISMRVDGGFIQYSTDEGETWVNLISKSDLKGDKGADGKDGTNGITPTIGDNGNWYLGATDTGKPSRGEKGGTGPAGAGVPDGGTAGQLLSKTETGTEWIDPPQSGVQPDWNQNDDTQPDYVKNRPFYTGDPVETVLVEETTAQFSGINSGYTARVPSTFSATVGETYKVSWDGSVYECICVTVNGIPCLFIGNLSIANLGSDTGEPFVMGVFNGQGIEIYTEDTSASHTFSISKTVAPVVKIDKKYLAQPDWNQNDENAADFVKNRPFYANSLVSVSKPGNSKEFWYKVSDAIPTGEHSVGAPCSIVVEGERTNSEIFQSTDDYYAATGGRVVVVLKDNVKIEGITFPKKGTYFAYRSSVSFVSGFALGADADSEITWAGRTEEIKKIDAKYLPDTVATKSEVEAAASTANTAAKNAQTTANNALQKASEAQHDIYRIFNTIQKMPSENVTFELNDPSTYGIIVTSNSVEYAEIGEINIYGYSNQVIKIWANSTYYTGWHFTVQNGVVRCDGAGMVAIDKNASNVGVFRRGKVYMQKSKIKAGNTLTLVLANSNPIHKTLKIMSDSGKVFKITVDDSGTLTATEVV